MGTAWFGIQLATAIIDALLNQGVNGWVAAFVASVILFIIAARLIAGIWNYWVQRSQVPPLEKAEPYQREDERDLRQALSTLRGVDTDFNLDHLYNRIIAAYEKLLRATDPQLLEQSRAFMSDGVHERLLARQLELKLLRQREVIDVSVPARCELHEAERVGSFEHVAVRIDAAISRALVSNNAADDAPAGVAKPDTLSEVWTFLRRRSATRDVRRGLMEGHCPNCSTPLTMNQHSQCPSCRALLRNGEFDWILVEKSNAADWRRTQAFDVIGADVLLMRDPYFNIAFLEDRASVMFERRLQAQRLGRLDPIRKFATSGYCEHVRPLIEEQIWYRQAHVESVRSRGILPSADFDRALIEICWDAAVVARDKPPESPSLRTLVGRHLMVLCRKPNVRSEVSDGFGSAHCPCCGAPDGLSTETACANCGSAVTDGSLTWNLTELVQFNSPNARRYLDALHEVELDVDAVAFGRRPILPKPFRRWTPPRATRTELLAWAVAVARADGVISGDERVAISELGLRAGVAPEQIERMLASTALEFEAPKSSEELQGWLEDLARISMCDGKIAEQESAVLILLARRLGMDEAKARVLLSKARSKMYDEAPIDLHAQWRDRK